ncbi:DUF4424 family protein [Methylorubrum extorquens]
MMLDQRSGRAAVPKGGGRIGWHPARPPAKPEGYTRAFEVPYIVTTARNWAGRIGRFTLTVDQGRADALVSFCRQGVRKTEPTTFVWEARDYVPDSDLRVLLVSNDPAFLGDR